MTSEVEQSDREAAEEIVSAANIVTHDGYYEVDIDKAAMAVARYRKAETAALRAEVAALDTTPWKDFHGPLPDWDSPLRCVFDSGIEYAVKLLAATLGVDDYEICDGTEDFDGDLGGTLFNIVLAAMPKHKNGDEMHPSEVLEEIAALRAELERLREERDDLLSGFDDIAFTYFLRSDSAERAQCNSCKAEAFFPSSIKHKSGCLFGKIRAALSPEGEG